MPLNDERWHMVDRLLEGALEQPVHLRSQWLEQACNGDEALRVETAALVAAHQTAGSFLELPASVLAMSTGIGDPDSHQRPRLDHYDIRECLGRGGMGAVYRATDRRLGRDVAIKFLPPSVVDDHEWLRRFHQEARIAASLNHPNVVAVHDVGSGDSGPYLVSELLEGNTLRSRLQRGSIGIREAIDVALGVARGLAAAHERGIVHRDLKPENVFLTRDGQIKIIDFGIAKRQVQRPVTPINQFDTTPGVVLGTVDYLSPEQAAGTAPDPRSDLFALGVLVYEMIAGRRPFSRATREQTMQAILEDEAPLFAASLSVPVAIERVVSICLAKDPARRFQSAGDLALALESLAGGADHLERRRTWRSFHLSAVQYVAALAVVLAVALAGLIVRLRSVQGPVGAPLAFDVSPPVGTLFASGPIVSPDGASIAFIAAGLDGRYVWIRRLETLTARRLDATNGAQQPFWSPDSRSLGFFADGQLKRVDVSQGVPVALADAPTPRGGAWTASGTIVYAPSVSDDLFAVAAGGGKPWRVTTIDRARGDNSHRWPAALPDGHHVIFASRNIAPQQSGLYVADLDPGAAPPVLLMRTESNGVMATSASGANWVLLVKNGALMAEAFDVRRGVITGDEESVADSVGSVSPLLPAAFSSSQGHVLAYSSWAGPRQQVEIEGLDGRAIRPIGPPGTYLNLRLSPDGSELAVTGVDDSGQVDISVVEVVRNRGRRLTSQARFNGLPSWSPDGRQIAFAADRAGDFNLYLRAADGTGAESCLVCAPGTQTDPEWTPNGRFVLYESVSNKAVEIWSVQTASERQTSPLLTSRFTEISPRVSPDGRSLAYVSDETGQREVYIRRFTSDGDVPTVGPAATASIGGGNEPRWRRDGRVLYYVAPDRHVMSVIVGDDLHLSSPTRLAVQVDASPGGPRPLAFAYYDVADDASALIVSRAMAVSAAPVTVVTGWSPSGHPSK